MNNVLYKKIIIFCLVSFLVFFNAEFWHLNWLGLMVLGLFLFFSSIGFEKFLAGIFHLTDKICARILAGFLSFAFIGSLSGIFILFGRLNSVIIALIFLVIGLFSVLAGEIKPKVEGQKNQEIKETEEETVDLEPKKYYIVIFLFLIFSGLYFLTKSSLFDGALITPWQIISGNYIYLFFLSTLILGALIFSKISVKSILVLIIIAYLAMLSYLPLSSNLFWGADGWRHLAILEQVKNSGSVEIVNYSAEGNWVERINPGLFAYSQFWGVVSTVNQMTGIDLIALIAWLQPIIAGIILPIILYQLGVVLNFGKRKSLFLAWLGLWPFALHSAGAFSLPVNFGLLFFLIVLLLLIKRISSPNNFQIPALALLFFISFFGYSSYLILFALGWIIVEKILYSNRHHSDKLKKWMLAGLLIFSILAVPLIEIVAGYSKINSQINLFSSAKQLVGNISGFYLANGPRPHLIETGNIFFNQAPTYGFMPNGFTEWRYWIVVLMFFAVVAIFFGARQMKKRGESYDKLFIILSLGVIVGYFICRYFLDGSHLLSRRLEPIIAVFGIVFIFAWLQNLFAKKAFFPLIFIFIFSIGIASSYSLGPTSRVMSETEFQSARNIWQEINGSKDYCVIADTYPLLALEALSAKKIIGGGFPIDKDFGQSELTALYGEMKINNDDENLWNQARDLTGADKCYLLVGEKIYTKEFIN